MAAPQRVTAKDLILAIIGRSALGGNGHVAEYGGEAIRAPFDGRTHTVCT